MDGNIVKKKDWILTRSEPLESSDRRDGSWQAIDRACGTGEPTDAQDGAKKEIDRHGGRQHESI